MDSSLEEPIFAPTMKKEPLKQKKIGVGTETPFRGVVRNTYEIGPDNTEFVFVDRYLLDEAKAITAMAVYQRLKQAGLPVTSFAKTIRKKENGEIRFFLAMEDLTENDRYKVSEIRAQNHNDYSFKTPKMLEGAENRKQLQKQMVRALAVMHNLGVYEFHPTISFVLRTKLTNDTEKIEDFRIIDYSNFKIYDPQSSSIDREKFVELCQKNLDALIEVIALDNDQKAELSSLYDSVRESNLQRYN
jgi:hypothetical protein